MTKNVYVMRWGKAIAGRASSEGKSAGMRRTRPGYRDKTKTGKGPGPTQQEEKINKRRSSTARKRMTSNTRTSSSKRRKVGNSSQDAAEKEQEKKCAEGTQPTRSSNKMRRSHKGSPQVKQ